MDLSRYPLFEPPVDLAGKPATVWAKDEARTYMEWLMASMPARVDEFVSSFQLDGSAAPESVLLAGGQRLESALGDPATFVPSRPDRAMLAGHEVTFESGPMLTTTGYALSADMGLLMARLLTTHFETTWEIVRRPKSDVAFNLPALFGFNPVPHMDPIRISANVANKVLRGSASAEGWLNAYKTWSAMAKTRHG